MFDNPHSAETALCLFISYNANGLLNAAMLLGGEPWYKKVRNAVADIHDGPALNRSAIGRLMDIYDLLALKHVHDRSRPEAGFFSTILPDDPCVEEICLLSDELHELLEAFVESDHYLNAKQARIDKEKME